MPRQDSLGDSRVLHFPAECGNRGLTQEDQRRETVSLPQSRRKRSPCGYDLGVHVNSCSVRVRASECIVFLKEVSEGNSLETGHRRNQHHITRVEATPAPPI
jgi:hypothetical protein